MKVNSATSQNIQKAQKPSQEATKKASKDEIKAKIRAKFGVEVDKPKKKAKSDTVVSIDKKGNKEVSKSGFGDVKNNDPKSEATQEKLKKILRTGAFDFNPKERSALKDILG